MPMYASICRAVATADGSITTTYSPGSTSPGCRAARHLRTAVAPKASKSRSPTRREAASAYPDPASDSNPVITTVISEASVPRAHALTPLELATATSIARVLSDPEALSSCASACRIMRLTACARWAGVKS